jgi:hypothetical protein
MAWPGHPEAMKMSCREGYFHTSDPWPLLQGHPEGMKIMRGRRLGPTSALLGAAKEPVHASVSREPHRHPKLLPWSTNIRLFLEEAPAGGGLIFTSGERVRAPVGQNVHQRVTFEVHKYRPVAGPATESKVVHAQDPRRLVTREPHGADMAQQGVPGDHDPEVF